MTRFRFRPLQIYLPGLLFCLILLATHAVHADSITLRSGDTEIGVQVYPAKGRLLFIWQMNEAGPQPGDQTLAQTLARRGYETWVTNVLEDYFLPSTSNNMDRIPAQAFATVLDAASRHNKKIIIASSGRGAIPILRGVRAWQQAHPNDKHLLGTILLSPKLFEDTPDPGQRGKLMPIARATNQTIALIQPDKSPWYWKLDQMLAGLEHGGSDVFLQPLHGIRDRFYFRPDATAKEQQVGKTLPDIMQTAITLLTQQKARPRAAVAQIQSAPPVRTGKKDHALTVYKGNPVPPPLKLPTLNGQRFDLASLKGRVVLVNFWASWCPPCVHEMPSMQRLANDLRKRPFTIVGVNMAEDRATITNFLQHRVKVDFPILLDRDGRALKAWGVFAFPTSYVIDTHGKIRYALFGSIDWDTADIRQRLEQLMAE